MSVGPVMVAATMQGPLDRLFRDMHRSGTRGDRFDIAYGLAEPESKASASDDEPWAQDPWGQEQSVGATIAGLLGICFAAVIGYFPFGFTLFVAPLPVILVVYALWVVSLRVVARQRTRHAYVALAIPFVEVAAWAVLMWFGWTQLHWPPLTMPGLT